MGSAEKWILAIAFVAIAFYFFHWNALYLGGLLALIYLFSRSKRR